MVPFYGDYDTTETVVLPFNTFDSNDPSASVTITNLANTDIHIHKDGGTTQRSSSNGVTVSINFDMITGNHICSIDLSDDTDSGFYAAGSRYQVRMEGTTVDGATVNAWIGAFSVGCTLRPTTAGRTLDVTATGAAGIDWGNVENQGTTVDLSDTATNLVDTTTTNTDMRGTDSAALASVCTEARLAELDAANLPADNARIETDTQDIQSRLPAALVNSRMDSTIDATGMESGAVSNILTTQMTESYAANGTAPTLAQAQFAIHQMLMQFGISSTTLTVKKLDNSTTAFLVTLDDATNPTSAERQ